MPAIVVLDGITVQHAAELLLDTQATQNARAACRDTYLRCLEDVAFALIYGGTLAVSKSLPVVGATEAPGRELCEYYRELVYPIDDQGFGTPGSLLSDPEATADVATMLTAFRAIPRRDFPFWSDFIVREADAYFWPHDSEKQQAPLSADAITGYTFGKRYWTTPALQDNVQGPLLDELTSKVYERVAARAATQHQAREFVRQVVTAHMIIFDWYQRGVTNIALPGEASVRLPHVTRATLLSTNTYEAQLQRVRRILMPRVLAELLVNKPSRSQVLARIGELACDTRLEPLRSMLQEALTEFSSDKLDRIADSLEKQAASLGDVGPTDFALKAGFVGPIPRAEAEVRWRRSAPNLTTSIRFALRRTPDVYEDLLTRAIGVFPELRE